MEEKPPLVSVTIVTFNSSRFIELCLEAVFKQRYRAREVIVVDNASTDGSAKVLAGWEGQAKVIRNNRNIGFAAGQNQAIRASAGDWVLTLNPDVRLRGDFLERLIEMSPMDHKAGIICGKLLQATPELQIPAQARIDSAGIYFRPSLRHFDRGWNEPDDGQYDRMEYVFGASGAAALYRRAMIEEVSQEDGFFDPDFFTYREDADVAWRAQLMGWRCLYVPQAVGHHVRRMVPSSRRSAPAVLRMHSVKNRFLMLAKNMTRELYRRTWLAAGLRDLLVVGGCLLSEPGALPAFWHLARCLPGALAKRRDIMRRRVAGDDYIAHWFDHRPTSAPFRLPVPGIQRTVASA